jgi:hypothetical protein
MALLKRNSNNVLKRSPGRKEKKGEIFSFLKYFIFENLSFEDK